MKLLVSGDPHLKISTIETAKRFLAWLEQSIRAESPELTVLMGDLFDTHSIVRVEIMTLWIRFAERMKKEGYEIISLVGNHDQASPGSELNSLICLEPYMIIADRPMTYRQMGFIPYYHSQSEFEAAARSLVGGGREILFVHQTFQGAQYENGFFDPDGFSTETLKEFKWVISGHVHKIQRLGNILYVGSPYHANFNDAGEKKAIFVMDTENPKLITKILKSPLPTYEVVRTTDAAYLQEFPFSENNHYKVIFSSTKASVQALVESAEFKGLKKRFKITFVPEFTDEVNREVRISEATSMEGMLDLYVGKMMNTDLDRERLLSLSKQFLTQAGTEGAGVK